MKFLPAYLSLSEREFSERIERLFKILENCELCPRRCHKNRLKGEKGFCRSTIKLMVYSYHPHFGEEEPLVGRSISLFIADRFGVSLRGGSGTIFFTNCNLGCVYCQNYEISHLGIGQEVSIERLAEMMIELQNRGCHNINFVSPTHFTPQIVKAVYLATKKGLKLPLVWNCGGYENVEVIKILDGIIDIYMPDLKYSDSEPARKYSDAPDYFEQAKQAIKEMHRQVGDLKLDDRGIAQRGLLIRHLVLPNNLAGSQKVLEFIAKEISVNSYVNIMSQYRACGQAFKYPELNDSIASDYQKAIKLAKELGLTRGI
ncbi:MAG: radical SAM protein [Elusimicrobiales bacterium]